MVQLVISLKPTEALNAIWCSANKLHYCVYQTGICICEKKKFWKRKYWISGGKTHRGLVSKEFLYDFNQLVLLFWIQAASKEEYITKQEMLDKELAIICS